MRSTRATRCRHRKPVEKGRTRASTASTRSLVIMQLVTATPVPARQRRKVVNCASVRRRVLELVRNFPRMSGEFPGGPSRRGRAFELELFDSIANLIAVQTEQ